MDAETTGHHGAMDKIIGWSDAAWLNPPASAEEDGDALLVTARENSDFWRTTSYGFVHDDGHALLTAFPSGSAVEVEFVARLDELYDQAGLMVRVDAETWIKAGIELSDGFPQLGAVVTHGRSDWSVAPVPEWAGRRVTVRASRAGDAVTIRARREDEPWRLVRLAPLDPDATAAAGPFCCSPSRAGLTVRFTRFTTGPADAALHG
jgi:regulation of enolase protein 1 (concanavalin A-like superfamily)